MGRFRVSGELFYDAEIEAMRQIESNTMFVDFSHVMSHSNILQKAISDEFLRFEPYLKNACKRFVMDQKPTFISDDNPNKDINLAFFNLPVCKRSSLLSLFPLLLLYNCNHPTFLKLIFTYLIIIRVRENLLHT